MEDDIDFVVTWVDGSDPTLAEKRKRFAQNTAKVHHQSGVDEITTALRWRDHEEISYMLRSAHLFAPWVRRIWIVTDNQKPKLDVPAEVMSKIAFVDHSEIFAGFEEDLPTFNSVSIETMLWRIPGLAENFVYFNDDCFIANPVQKTDFFTGEKIVLRGKIVHDVDTGLLYGLHQKNALELVQKRKALCNAHVAIPAKRSLLEAFFEQNPEALKKNISHRFRHPTQFSTFALSTYLCSIANIAQVKIVKDYSMVSASVAQSGRKDAMLKALHKLDRPHILLGCINNVGALEDNDIDVQAFMHEHIFKSPPKKTLMSAILRRLPNRKLTIE